MGQAVDLREIHEFVAHLAIRAGSYLWRQALDRRFSGADDLDVQVKENAADLVTRADLHAEKLISDAIRARYPDFKIIGEESYGASKEKRFLLDDAPTFVVDPLDGTVNFFHGFPTSCVSVGFCVNRRPVAGAIFAPFLNGLHPTHASGSLYSAAKGLGSWNTPISMPYDRTCLQATDEAGPWPHAVRLPYFLPAPIPPDAPKGCIFLSEWGKARSDQAGSNLHKKADTFLNFAAEVQGRSGKGGMVHGIRSLGSAALDMCYVATGAVDIFWEGGCWEWDVCAGIVIVEEAGGRVVPPQCPPGLETEGDIPDADLGSRLYLSIRPAADNGSESGRQAQDRLIREVWRRAEPLTYDRPR